MTGKEQDIRETLLALGKENTLDILKYVYTEQWSSASEVAQALDMHVATAVKHLTELYDVGILEKQKRKGKTRGSLEYSVRKERFVITLDLPCLAGEITTREVDVENTETLFYILYHLVKKAEEVIGKREIKIFEEAISGGNGDLKSIKEIWQSALGEGDYNTVIKKVMAHLKEMSTREIEELDADIGTAIDRFSYYLMKEIGKFSTKALIRAVVEKELDDKGTEDREYVLSLLPIDDILSRKGGIT